MNALSFAQQWLLALCGTGAVIGVVLSWFDHPVALDDEQEVDGAPCCPDPGCPGRNGTRPCTFPGYADWN